MINTGTLRATNNATLQLTGINGGNFDQHRRHDRGAERLDGATGWWPSDHRRHADDIGYRRHHDTQRGRRAGNRYAQRRDDFQRQSVRRRGQQPHHAGGHDHQQRDDGARLDRPRPPISTVSGNVTLTGSGVVTLSDSLAIASAVAPSSRLINDTGHTIQGSGYHWRGPRSRSLTRG